MKIFIGWDSREPEAYDVCKFSIERHASRPVEIIPLKQTELRESGLYTREKGMMESTEFSLTRFLVPKLCNYEGVALFLDCDILIQDDITKVLEVIPPEADSPYHCPAVWATQHNYKPKNEMKFLDQYNSTYPKKNWSSFMLFNNAKCKALTPEYVNSVTGLMLHRFWWLENENEIGSIPLEWNWLVGEYALNPEAKGLHYTLGGPWFEGYKDCDHADLWFAERDKMLAAKS